MAYIHIEKIDHAQHVSVYQEEHEGRSSEETYAMFHHAKARFEVDFEHADYHVDLYSSTDDMLDTFSLAELGYRSLTSHHM